ncbi:MAG: competence/damage-inducible protein A [Proteobacteria bacterium]|nr:competence/damage-inducible protein A [Pseudomonadota bacterium]
MSTAGILIIGNEILTGKIRDENTPYLLDELRGQGVDVGAVHMIPDEVDLIAGEVRAFSERFDHVLTTGGVGPTHDDVTMEAIAQAFHVPLETHAEMERRLREALKDGEPNASQLKMCLLPQGARLIHSRDLWFPLVYVDNVYIFPGIPRLLQAKFESVRTRFTGDPVYLRRVYLCCIESDVAEDLHALLDEFPELLLGSYPRTTARTSESDYLTMLTLESRDEFYMLRAVDSLVGRLQSNVLRVEN